VLKVISKIRTKYKNKQNDKIRYNFLILMS
jgi:hypothetical protein